MPKYLRSTILLLIYLFINDLFILKYLPPDYSKVLAIAIYSTLVMLVYGIINSDHLSISRWFNSPYIVFVGIPVILYIYSKVSPFSVTPDRWSALFYWSEYLLKGLYPYGAHTHMGGYGSPFPIWQIVHMPFYFLGDEIFAHVVVLLLLFFFLNKNKETIISSLFICLLFLSPAYWWEVLVRSDLMNNLMIAMMLIFLLEKNKVLLSKSSFWIGLVAGLVCCTRIFLFIPFLIYIIPNVLQMKPSISCKIVGGLIIGFVVPFIPFLYWNANMLLHFRYNPIMLQIRQGSVTIFFIGLVFVVCASLLWKKFSTYFFVVSCFLFLFILAMFVRKSWQVGTIHALMYDGFDLSYFGIAMPFLLVAMSYNYKHEIRNKFSQIDIT